MTTVILVGDSITEGIGAFDAQKTSYAAVLASLLGKEYEVFNFGRNGATLTDSPNGKQDSYLRLRHFENAKCAARSAVEKGNKVIVSVMLGTNDADVIDYGFVGTGKEYYNRYHDVFVGTMLSLVDAFFEIDCGISFVLCKSPYSYDPIKHKNFGNLESVWTFQEEIYAKMKERGIKTVLCDAAEKTSPEALGKRVGTYFSDGLHPSDKGHAEMAGYFYDAVKRAETEFG